MSYKIPLFDLNFDEAEEKAALETIRSRWISCGPMCTELERDFSGMLGSKYALSVTNCTAALHLAVLTVGIGNGDEVIVPSMTFVATVNAVRYAGGIPVFCDISGKEDLTISPEMVERLITKKTKAIIVMHYGGFSCNMDAIMDIARKYSLKVIEDACHGPLSEYKGQKLGTIGDVGCFSFFSNKNISTGEGGMLVTNDPEIYQNAKLMRSHGMTTMSYERSSGHSTNYDVVTVGYNYRMDDIRAGIGVAQLKKLPADIERRENIRKEYLKRLENVADIIVPFKTAKYRSSSYIFPIVLRDAGYEKRGRLREFLAENGIQTSIHYPPVHRFIVYRQFVQDKLPQTEYVADNEITLPMYGKLTLEQIKYICDVLEAGIRRINDE